MHEHFLEWLAHPIGRVMHVFANERAKQQLQETIADSIADVISHKVQGRDSQAHTTREARAHHAYSFVNKVRTG